MMLKIDTGAHNPSDKVLRKLNASRQTAKGAPYTIVFTDFSKLDKLLTYLQKEPESVETIWLESQFGFEVGTTYQSDEYYRKLAQCRERDILRTCGNAELTMLMKRDEETDSPFVPVEAMFELCAIFARLLAEARRPAERAVGETISAFLKKTADESATREGM